MQHIKIPFLTAILLCFVSVKCLAHDFMDNDIYYNILSSDDLTVEVTSKNNSSNSYSGSVSIPNTVTYSGTTYSVTSIGKSAFYNCTELNSISIPSSVTIIGSSAFRGCTGLTNIEVPNSVMSIGNNAFQGCIWLKSISIPNGVTSIGNYTFSGCTGLISVTIGSGVSCIGDYAFSGCEWLKNITIPNSVTSIGNYTFYLCKSLNTTIPNTITSIGNGAFSGCKSLTRIVIPDSVISVGNSAFRDCTGLTSVSIGNSVTIIAYEMFYGCTGLTNVTIGSSVKNISANAFCKCKNLARIVIPDSVTDIGNSAFYNCVGLQSVTIGNSVKNIGNNAFEECSGLTSIEIPNSVIDIGECAFEGCAWLKSVTILNSVTNIGECAFLGCMLTSVTVNYSTPATIGFETFSNQANAILYVPVGSKSFYEVAEYWKDFGQIEEIINTENLPNSNPTDFENIVYMECFNANPGDEIEVPILMKNTTSGDIANFDFYLELPADISPVLDEDGFPIVSLSTERTTARKHSVYGDVESNGRIHIYSSSSRNSYTFSGTSGEVATITLKIADNVTEDNYPILMRDITMERVSGSDSYTIELFKLSACLVDKYLIDGEIYSTVINVQIKEFTYTRTFSSADKWQALYVPFSIPIDTLDKYGLQVAELNDTHMYDTDEDGEFDKTTLEFLYLKRGATEPNYPYLIKSASAGDVTLTMTDIEVKATEETEIECSTTRAVFKIRGTYAGVSGAVMYANNYYAMGGGTLVRMANADSGLKPQRWYLSVENKDGSPAESLAAQMRIAIDGIEIEESETAISEVNAIGQKQDEVYMLDGRKLNGTAALKSGLYVKNHKKLFVR